MAHHSRNCLIIYTTPTRKYKTQKGKEIPMKNVADLHLWFLKKFWYGDSNPNFADVLPISILVPITYKTLAKFLTHRLNSANESAIGSERWDSNSRPPPYESGELPLLYSAVYKSDFNTIAKITKSMATSRAVNGALPLALLRKY